jgi:Ca2+-transporting ATPase
MAIACILLFWCYLPDEGSADHGARISYAQTMVFLTLSLLQFFHVMAIRSSAPCYRVGLWSNYRLTVAVLLGVALQFAVIYVPQLRPFFHTVPLSAGDVLIAVAVSTLPFVVIELWKQFEHRE